jgi:putative spermidine/putrescine transport system substrate-binding protein
MTLKRTFITLLLLTTLVFSLVGCGKENEITQIPQDITIEEITDLAIEEGKIVSVGMPNSWANWQGTWNDLNEKYGLKHSDTDLSSAEEIAKFEAEKNNATADIGDVGWAYGTIAAEKDLTLPFKTSYWDSIPDWAKDENGHWMLAYTGTLSILTNKELVSDPPKSFKDILEGDYTVSLGDVNAGTQSQMAVLAAAMAFGGDESNIQPGIDFFSELAKKGRLATNNNSLANVENGEVEVTLLWDFTALGYKNKIDETRFVVTIPEEASISTGYSTIINKYAPHPYAAMLTREYIFSDEGQINLAKGYARPIREDVDIPSEISGKFLPDEQYSNTRKISDFEVWSETVKELPLLWQEHVLVHIN